MSVSISVVTTINFIPIGVPDFFVMAESNGNSSVPVAEATQEVVDTLVDRFISDLYAKCGKRSPWRKAVMR